MNEKGLIIVQIQIELKTLPPAMLTTLDSKAFVIFVSLLKVFTFVFQMDFGFSSGVYVLFHQFESSP